MKKLFYSITFLAIFGLLSPAMVRAQTTMDEKAKIEKRSNDDTNQADSPEVERKKKRNTNERHFNHRAYRGGFQSFDRGQYRADRHQRFDYGRDENFKHHPRFNHYRFRCHGYGARKFRGNHQFRHHNFRGQNFQNGRQGFNRSGDKNHMNEMKTLNDQIWKDGVMDLKERDMLQNKRKEFRSQRFGSGQNNENIKGNRKPPVGEK